MSKPTKLDDIFTDVVAQQYISNCKREGTAPTYRGLLEHAINCNMISPKVVRDFVVINEYPRFAYQHNGSKQKAVWQLEETLGIPERTIYYIISEGPKEFFPSNPNKTKWRNKRQTLQR